MHNPNKLSDISKELLQTSCWGCEILRTTKKTDQEKARKQQKRGQEVPEDVYGPIQVRFCEGAIIQNISKEKATKIAQEYNQKIEKILEPYRWQLVQNILRLAEDIDIEKAKKIDQICQWIDNLDEEPIDVIPINVNDELQGYAYRLKNDWVCYVEEDDVEQAESLASELRKVFETKRKSALVKHKKRLLKALEVD